MIVNLWVFTLDKKENTLKNAKKQQIKEY